MVLLLKPNYRVVTVDGVTHCLAEPPTLGTVELLCDILGWAAHYDAHTMTVELRSPEPPPIDPDSDSLDDLFAWGAWAAKHGGITPDRSEAILTAVRRALRGCGCSGGCETVSEGVMTVASHRVQPPVG